MSEGAKEGTCIAGSLFILPIDIIQNIYIIQHENYNITVEATTR